MKIGEVSKQVGLRASALRYYEALGLLPPADRVGGKRVYGGDVLDRVTFIQFAQQCGFNLDEVATLLGMGQPTTSRSAERLRKLAALKLAEIEAQMARALGMRRMLEAVLGCECLTADQCGRKIRTKMIAQGISSPTPHRRDLGNVRASRKAFAG